jgi:CDP-diacylglycerol--glycerol-3-phosphate 3-phosphatidyltransferase
LVTSQVISYVKARAEASGLRAEGGIIERPERLVIVLVGAGLSDLPFYPIPWVLDAAVWLLAVASLVTLGQRLHAVRRSAAGDHAGQGPAADKPEAGTP